MVMERSEPSDDGIYVLRCMIPPSAGGVQYVRSYGLKKRAGLHLTDVMDAALRFTAREARPLAQEIRDKYGLDVDLCAVGTGGGPPINIGPV